MASQFLSEYTTIEDINKTIFSLTLSTTTWIQGAKITDKGQYVYASDLVHRSLSSIKVYLLVEILYAWDQYSKMIVDSMLKQKLTTVTDDLTYMIWMAALKEDIAKEIIKRSITFA